MAKLGRSVPEIEMPYASLSMSKGVGSMWEEYSLSSLNISPNPI